MTHAIQQMRETSVAFRHALLKSEKKRIVGVIVFVCCFAVLAAVRIFVLTNATLPPMLCPTTTGFSTRSCPQSHARSSANPAGVYSCRRLVAFTMAAEIDRDDAMATAKVLELRSHVAVVTAPAVHQKHRRQSASRLLIGQRYAITDEFFHDVLV
jgi:hypothetical protein